MFKVRKSDMDKNASNFIMDILNALIEREKRTDSEYLVIDLKSVLDSRFGGDWNVMVGKTVGYAMKSRKKSSIILYNSVKSEVFVCWKSPGFEVEDLDTVKIKATLTVKESDSLLDGITEPRKTNTVKSPDPDSHEYSFETRRAILIIDALTDEVCEMDQQAAARHIRAQYVSNPKFYGSALLV